MKNQITITRAEFQKAVTETFEDLRQSIQNNPKITSPMVASISGLLFCGFATKLTIKLFQDDETLEIEE